MKIIYKIFSINLYIILLIPLIVLISKLTTYIYENEFKEWWLTMLWLLTLPLTTLALFIAKKGETE